MEEEFGDVIIFKLSLGIYQIEVYWRPGDCRKTLIETDDLEVANKVFFTALRNL